MHRIGISVAPSFTNIQYESGIRNREQFKIGLNAALNYRVDFKSDYFFGADVMFRQNGAIVDGRSESLNLNGSPFFSKIKFNHNMLAIPLKAGFNFGRDNQGYFALGIIPSTLLNAKITIYELDGNVTSFKLERPTPAIFDLAGLVELGIRAKINDKTSFFSSLQYQHSYVSFMDGKRSYYSRDFGLAVNFGLLFQIK